MALQLDPITPTEYDRLAGGDPAYDYLKVMEFREWRLYLHPDQTYLYRCYAWLIGEHTDLQQRYQLTGSQRSNLDQLVSWVHGGLHHRAPSPPDMINEYYAGNEYQLHRGHAHLHLIPRYAEPPVFAGRRFPDVRFGKNHAPYERTVLSKKQLIAIRDSLATYV